MRPCLDRQPTERGRWGIEHLGRVQRIGVGADDRHERSHAQATFVLALAPREYLLGVDVVGVRKPRH